MGNHPAKRDERRKSGREKRLAEALRANLKRRKAQQRQRDGAAGHGERQSTKESG